MRVIFKKISSNLENVLKTNFTFFELWNYGLLNDGLANLKPLKFTFKKEKLLCRVTSHD